LWYHIGRICVVNLSYQKPDCTFSTTLRVVVVVVIVPEYYCCTDEFIVPQRIGTFETIKRPQFVTAENVAFIRLYTGRRLRSAMSVFDPGKYNIIIFIMFTRKLCRRIKLTNSTDSCVYIVIIMLITTVYVYNRYYSQYTVHGIIILCILLYTVRIWPVQVSR